jgi:hypothetical protein
MIQVRIINKPLRILDFDIEARPLDFIGGDFVGKEPTVIACSVVGYPQMYCWCLGEVNKYDETGYTTMLTMLNAFRYWYDTADMVTGHYIRAFDIPIINAAMVEHGMEPLGDKLTCDTKLDLIKMTGVSKSQKNLAEMLSAQNEKLDMSGPKWRSANRMEASGIAKARERCIGDVRQHMEMREEMVRRGLLSKPVMWRGSSKLMPAPYVP